jgi:hypothetical protein
VNCPWFETITSMGGERLGSFLSIRWIELGLRGQPSCDAVDSVRTHLFSYGFRPRTLPHPDAPAAFSAVLPNLA